MKDRELISQVALERIARLYDLALKKSMEKKTESKKLAKRYVKILKEMAQHYKVKIPKKIKEKICKRCGNVLIPGLNCSVRIASSKGFVVYTCECGFENKIFYK